MALTKQELKAIKMFKDNLKNSGMNPWGNFKRGEDITGKKIRSPKSKIFNKEDATEQPDKEKFKKKS
jgi:hypothetical protein